MDDTGFETVNTSGEILSPMACTKCRGDTFKLFATEYKDNEVTDFMLKCVKCGRRMF